VYQYAFPLLGTQFAFLAVLVFFRLAVNGGIRIVLAVVLFQGLLVDRTEFLEVPTSYYSALPSDESAVFAHS
jgi:uncharacterized membrane protein YdcZ (DUF606 family)